jgi:hypothetical protein
METLLLVLDLIGTFVFDEIAPKRLELLHDFIPAAKSIALLVNPANRPVAAAQAKGLQGPADALGVRLTVLGASNATELEDAFASVVRDRIEALQLGVDPLFGNHIDQIIALATRSKIPTIYPWRDFTVAGGLVNYGSIIPDAYRQVGVYTGQISERGRSCRNASAAADQVRAGDQSQDRQGSGANDPTRDPRPRRRCYRINGLENQHPECRPSGAAYRPSKRAPSCCSAKVCSATISADAMTINLVSANTGDTRAVAEWLVDGARTAAEPQQVMAQLCDRLLYCGIPLWRAAVSVSALHPQIVARRFIWRPGTAVEISEGRFRYTTHRTFATVRSRT